MPRIALVAVAGVALACLVAPSAPVPDPPAPAAARPLPSAAGAAVAPSARAAIEETVRRYEARPAPPPSGAPDRLGPRLVNRGGGIRATFERAGVLYEHRGDATRRVRMDVLGLAREAGGWAAGDAAPRIDGERVVYDRPWGLEWYASRASGIEQGFRIDAYLGGRGDLEIRMATDGEVARADDDRVLLAAGGRDVLEYRDLVVLDASGRRLASRIRCVPGEVRLVVDDSDAEYPLLVDPIATAPAWTFEPEQPGAHLARSVAGVGDVSHDGHDDVLVGAPDFDGWHPDEGRVFLFLGSAAGLSATPAWVGTPVYPNGSIPQEARYGHAVAGIGDVDGDGIGDFAIGSPGVWESADWGDLGVGAVTIHLGVRDGSSYGADWVVYGTEPSENFGWSIAAAGDVDGDGHRDVLIGAAGSQGKGYAALFRGTSGVPEKVPAWKFQGVQPEAFLGYAVAGPGDVNRDGYADVLVGEPFHDGAGADSGRVHAFHGSAAGLAIAPDWIAHGEPGEELGFAVAGAGEISGDAYVDVVAGGPGYSGQSGRIRVFRGGAAGLEAAPWWSRSGRPGYRLGAALARWTPASDGFLLGIPNYTLEGLVERGLAQLIRKSTGFPSSAWTRRGDASGDHFGAAVAAAGDVDGDGDAEVLVGAPDADGPDAEEGRAYLFPGG